MPRTWQSYVFNFADGVAISSEFRNLGGGAFGILIVPSTFHGRTLQLITDLSDATFCKGLSAASIAALNEVNLLTTAKPLVTGKNSFTATEIAEIGAVGPVRLKLNSAISGQGTQQALLWWKD